MGSKPSRVVSDKANVVKEFDPKRVRPFPDQPRKRFRGIERLARSIELVGQKSNGSVFLVKDDPDFDAELIDGERRLRACLLAKRPFRAEVQVDPKTKEDQFESSFVANMCKENHDLMEIAHGLDRLQKAGRTIVEMAQITGKSIAWVSQHLSMLKLHPEVQMLLVSDEDDDSDRKPLTFSLALLLTSLPEKLQTKLAQNIVHSEMGMSEARRLIMHEARGAGHELADSKRRGPKRQIRTLTSLTRDVSSRVGIYVDLPKEEMARLIGELNEHQKNQLVLDIEHLVENLSVIADAVQAQLPKKVVVKPSRPTQLVSVRAGLTR